MDQKTWIALNQMLNELNHCGKVIDFFFWKNYLLNQQFYMLQNSLDLTSQLENPTILEYFNNVVNVTIGPWGQFHVTDVAAGKIGMSKIWWPFSLMKLMG